MSRTIYTLNYIHIELADRASRHNAERKSNVISCKTQWNLSCLCWLNFWDLISTKTTKRFVTEKNQRKYQTLISDKSSLQWIHEVCANLHLRATDTSQMIWEQCLAALDLQQYSSRLPKDLGSLCLGAPFQTVLQSFPLTSHSLY